MLYSYHTPCTPLIQEHHTKIHSPNPKVLLYTRSIKTIRQRWINIWHIQHTREVFRTSENELVENQIICTPRNRKRVSNLVRQRTSQPRRRDHLKRIALIVEKLLRKPQEFLVQCS